MTTDELRKLLAKVTPGPWIADDFCEPDGRQVRVGTNDGTPKYYHRTATVAYCQTNHDDDRWHDVPLIGQVNAEANARLIALAPSLADEVLRLREAISGLETENAALLHDLKRQMTIANVECNEAARLREMVEGVSKRAFLAGHWEGWRGNQLSRAVQHVHAKEGWQLYVESNAFEKSLTQADERESD